MWHIAIALAVLLTVSGCLSSPPLVVSKVGCSSLPPVEWMEGVAGADLPDGMEVGDWIAFADAQTGKLDIANDHYRSGMGVIQRCEERDRASTQPRRSFLGL